MRITNALLALAASVFLPVAARAADGPAIETYTLKNGMEVVLIENHRVPAVHHALWFRVGAADDPAGKSGLAHFHEHMMFQGTARYKAGEYGDIIEHMGGTQNAFTSYDMTSYYANIPKERLPRIMALEADRLRGLQPEDKNALKEREVIIEERRARIENSPQALFSEQLNAALYLNHPYHLPTIGWKHEMEGLTKADVLDFHQRYYHANNAILVVSGDITLAELKPLAERYYASLPRRPVEPRIWKSEPPQLAARRVTMQHADVKQPLWVRSYIASSLGDGDTKKALPLELLAQLMGGGKTSELYQALVVKQKLAAQISVSYNAFMRGPGEFSISALPAEHVPPEQLEAAIDAELQRIMSGGIKSDDLARAKTLFKAETIYARDGLEGMARIAGFVRVLGLPLDYITKWTEMIDAVSAEDVQAAARAVLAPEHSVTGVLLPKAGSEAKDAH